MSTLDLACGLIGSQASRGLDFLLPLLADRRPALVPAVITGQVAHRQHRIDMLVSPAHACPFHAALHHQLVRTLHTSTPDGIAPRLKRGIR